MPLCPFFNPWVSFSIPWTLSGVLELPFVALGLAFGVLGLLFVVPGLTIGALFSSFACNCPIDVR